MIVIHSILTNNTAVSGGVAYIQNSSMAIQSSSFEYNRAIEKGGAIYADEQTSLSIYASNFTNNTVENNGGVMSLVDGSRITIGNCSFTGNNADSNGGVIGIQRFQCNNSAQYIPVVNGWKQWRGCECYQQCGDI